MWYLLRAAGAPDLAVDGVSSSRPDPAALLQGYRQAQVTSTAITQYYNQQLMGGGPPQDVQAAAVQDLLRLSGDRSLTSTEVTTVQGVLTKARAGQELGRADLDALQGVVTSLATRLVGASPGAAGMPEGLRAAVAATPNADRALETYQALRTLQAGPGGERLTDETIRQLTMAVATPQTTDARGQEGVMGKAGALRAAQALIAMTPEAFTRTTALLGGMDGAAEADTKRALLLESLGAGYRVPTPPAGAARNQQLFQDLEAFAGGIRDVADRRTLVDQTTLTGVDYGGASLRQRFETSCGPTDMQMLRGQGDPMYAWGIHQQGRVDALNATGQVAAQQQAWLERDYTPTRANDEGQAVPREVPLDYRRYTQAIDDYLLAQPAAPPETDAYEMAFIDRMTVLAGEDPQNNALTDDMSVLGRYMTDPTFAPDADEMATIRGAVTAINARDASFDPNVGIFTSRAPSSAGVDLARVEAIRGEVQQHGLQAATGQTRGLSLGDVLASESGRRYDTTSVDPANTGRVSVAFANQAATLLEAGEAVPLRIGFKPGHDAGHFMLMSDVRGAAPERQYLVSDPYRGTTQWVREADLRSGDFANDPRYGFGLGDADVTHMYFPQP